MGGDGAEGRAAKGVDGMKTGAEKSERHECRQQHVGFSNRGDPESHFLV